MNTSQFMDKQIMDLTNSQNNDGFVDLINSREDHVCSGSKEDIIIPNYDFQPTRPITISQQSILDSPKIGEARVRNSADSKTNHCGFTVKNHSSLEPIQHAKVSLDKGHNGINAALLLEIDSTMKKHTGNLLHALEGLSARISQMESRSRHLENLMDDLKVSFEDNQGSSDGKLRHLENILREVQTDVQVITAKQLEADCQLHLEKTQKSMLEQQSEDAPSICFERPAYVPQQSLENLPPVNLQTPPPSVTLPYQTPPTAIPSVPQGESYFPPNQTQEATNQEYQLPPPRQMQPPVPALRQPPPPLPPHPQYSQPPAEPLQNSYMSEVKPLQHSLQHHRDGAPSAPRSYPPTMHQPPHLPSASSPSQHFYGSQMHEPPSRSPHPFYPTSYGASSGLDKPPYPYGAYQLPCQYGNGSSIKQHQLSSAPAIVGESDCRQLPTARTLPQALPTASGIGTGAGAGGSSSNRVPIDDVVDKVTSMGFSRDQVRAMVRKLTENGQSVDLNVVLDKLMNDGLQSQPGRGWFGW